jgi:hypothetical protein
LKDVYGSYIFATALWRGEKQPSLSFKFSHPFIKPGIACLEHTLNDRPGAPLCPVPGVDGLKAVAKQMRDEEEVEP